jgi:glycosidase
MRTAISLSLCTALWLSSCGEHHEIKTHDVAMDDITSIIPEWAKSANIYEVNTRQYTAEGTLTAFSSHIPRLKEMGVDILWFMPVQPIGMERRKGTLGSYYSIADYTAVNPEFGTMDDFKKIVAKAHNLGMRVILDWVANHTAFDHPWAKANPDWYLQDDEGNIRSPEADWSDVAGLNYENPNMREAMIKEMAFWVREVGIDGFRCDVAFMVPTDFWEESVNRLKDIKPDIFMLAEADHPENQLLGGPFQADYAWTLHHIMNDVAAGKKHVSDFEAHRQVLDSLYGKDVMKMTFTTNHDENSWNGTVFERMGDGHKVHFVLAATWSHSFPLVYSGQEMGLDHRLAFFEKDTIRWHRPEFVSFYTAMLGLKHRQPALWNANYGGDFKALVIDDSNGIYAYKRQRGDSEVVVFLNFKSKKAQVDLKHLDLNPELKSYLSSGKVEWSPGIPTLDLPGYGFLVLTR